MTKTTNIQEVLAKEGQIVYTNKGVSMLPLIRQNRDIMIIEKKNDKVLKKNDVVLFVRSNGQYVLHRILKVNETDYWIVGDNCVSGEYVKENRIIGVLTGVIRDGKKITTDSKLYRLYVKIWCDLFPIRFVFLRCKWFIRRKISFIKPFIVHR